MSNSNIDLIEEEIAKLEEEQRSNQSELALLRKSKTAMLEQAKEDRKSADRLLLEELVNSANTKLADTSLQFENDQTLEAVLVKLDDDHLEEHFSTQHLNLKKVSKFLDLFSCNVKTIEKIFDTFDESGDFIRIDYDDQKFESLTFEVHGRDEDIKIFAKDDNCLTIELTKAIEYQSDKVSVMSGGIEYSFYMVDSYDSFYVDATVSGKCSINNFVKEFEHLSKKLDTAKIIEKD